MGAIDYVPERNPSPFYVLSVLKKSVSIKRFDSSDWFEFPWWGVRLLSILVIGILSYYMIGSFLFLRADWSRRCYVCFEEAKRNDGNNSGLSNRYSIQCVLQFYYFNKKTKQWRHTQTHHHQHFCARGLVSFVSTLLYIIYLLPDTIRQSKKEET